MSTEKYSYKRLPGKKKGFLIGYHTLWQGEDHLLQIYSRLGVEDYKRFYFDDIQAIVTRKTGTCRIQNIVIGALAGLFCLFAITSGGGWGLFHASVAAAILLILLINVIKGPTCETVLLTAVQTEKLLSLIGVIRTKKRDQRDRVAVYCERISETLFEARERLDRDRIPHGCCAAMDQYMKDLREVLSDCLSQVEYSGLESALAVAYRVEYLDTELTGVPNPSTRYRQLEQAAGKFRAVADKLRAL